MWKLKQSNELEDAYLKLFWKHHPKYYKKDDKKGYADEDLQKSYAYKYINRKNFEQFLVAEPFKLIKLHNTFFKEAKYSGLHSLTTFPVI